MKLTTLTGLLLIIVPLTFNVTFFLLQRAFEYPISCASRPITSYGGSRKAARRCVNSGMPLRFRQSCLLRFPCWWNKSSSQGRPGFSW